jgi:hypothetical protein
VKLFNPGDIVFLDTETKRFRPGCRFPPIVCVQWCLAEGGAFLMTARGEITDGSYDAAGKLNVFYSGLTFSTWFEQIYDLHWVGHSLPYEMGVFAADDPRHLPFIFRAMRENRATDTELRQKLPDIGRGIYRLKQYNLGAVAERHGDRANKEDPWRVHFDKLADVPLVEWPTSFFERVPVLKKDKPTGELVTLCGKDALAYALHDPIATRTAFYGQQKYHPDLLCGQFEQMRKFFALDLLFGWGLRTSPKRVAKLEEDTRAEIARHKEFLVTTCYRCSQNVPKQGHTAECPEVGLSGLVREEGSRDTKKAQWRMLWACGWAPGHEAAEDERMQPPLSKSGTELFKFWQKNNMPINYAELCEQRMLCLDRDSCTQVDDPLLKVYAEYSAATKVLSNDLEAWRKGIEYPIHPNADICDTTRVSVARPNSANLNRKKNIREAIVPRGFIDE